MAEAVVKANIFRRGFNKVTDYFKNIGHDYADVAKNVVEDSKARPLKAGVALSAVGLIGYAIKSNPTERDFNDKLCALRQQMALLPKSIHSSRADDKLSTLTNLINTDRLDYYDCWLFSLILKRDWDRNVRTPASQDSNLKDWPWQMVWRNAVDVGAFGQFFELDRAFLNYDVRQEEFDESNQLAVA
ncbi:hypothetical protein M3Y97_00223100 [Aphelenchoides bicaudatus]|nr:hypothetical protein M3Y97_00223100 [Aphelenchoides bicaudatus]